MTVEELFVVFKIRSGVELWSSIRWSYVDVFLIHFLLHLMASPPIIHWRFYSSLQKAYLLIFTLPWKGNWIELNRIGVRLKLQYHPEIPIYYVFHSDNVQIELITHVCSVTGRPDVNRSQLSLGRLPLKLMRPYREVTFKGASDLWHSCKTGWRVPAGSMGAPPRHLNNDRRALEITVSCDRADVNTTPRLTQ